MNKYRSFDLMICNLALGALKLGLGLIIGFIMLILMIL